MPVKLADTSLRTWLPGQIRVPAGGSNVSEPLMLPFFPEEMNPLAETGPWTDCLFDAAGQFPPRLTHWYLAVQSALATYSTNTFAPRPASFHVTVTLAVLVSIEASGPQTKCALAG